MKKYSLFSKNKLRNIQLLGNVLRGEGGNQFCQKSLWKNGGGGGEV